MRANKNELPMKRLDELISSLTPKVLSRSSTAKSTGTCKICRQPATEFRTALSRLEYSISAICQNCQDQFWGSE